MYLAFDFVSRNISNKIFIGQTTKLAVLFLISKKSVFCCLIHGNSLKSGKRGKTLDESIKKTYLQENTILGVRP